MGKENIQTQIEIAKQDLFNEKLRLEKENQKKKYTDEEYRRSLVIERQQKEERKLEVTRKIFAGTNIVETLEEIQKEHILNNNIIVEASKKNFWGSDKRCQEERLIPMDIGSNLNSIKAVFDNGSYGPGGDDREYDPSYKIMTITKKDNNFEFSFKNIRSFNSSKDFEISSANPTEIVKSILKVVALKQTGELR